MILLTNNLEKTAWKVIGKTKPLVQKWAPYFLLNCHEQQSTLSGYFSKVKRPKVTKKRLPGYFYPVYKQNQ